MRAVKAVKQSIQPEVSREVKDVLEVFRKMVNECMRVGSERDLTSRSKLQAAVYQRLRSIDSVEAHIPI